MHTNRNTEELESKHAGRVLGTWYLASEGARPSTRYEVPSTSVSTTRRSRLSRAASARSWVTLLRVFDILFDDLCLFDAWST